MRKLLSVSPLFALLFFLYGLQNVTLQQALLPGAFLTDSPSRNDIQSFEKKYGTKPFFVLLFLDWEKDVPKDLVNGIIAENSSPVITWEPWYAEQKKAVPYEEILQGKYDDYIQKFAEQLGAFPHTIYLRFAHEMNGNWYPWSSALIGPQNYQAMYRHVKDIFDSLHIHNVKWIFSINAENVPTDNLFQNSYPGDRYVDYMGIDGYNWGLTASWSRWKTFYEIFYPPYIQMVSLYDKDILITEFGSTSRGGDKAQWIKDAFSDMKQMKRLKGWILFNVNKETDWHFHPDQKCGLQLREEIIHDAKTGCSSVPTREFGH